MTAEPGHNLGDGVTAGFGALFDAHAPGLRRYLASRADPVVADDLVSETFVLALRRRETFDPERGSPQAWLFGIASNLLRHHHRDQARHLTGAARTRPRWRRPILIAAAVVLLVAGGLVLPTVRWGGKAGNTAAADALNRAAAGADRAAAAGDATPSGKYRYIDSVGWGAVFNATAPDTAAGEPSGTALVYLQQQREQMWVPADWHDTWLDRRSSTGQRQWLVGSEEDAAAQGLSKGGVPSSEPDNRGSCGQYFDNRCTGAGGWQEPTQSWIAALPTDPDKMWDKLYDESKGHGQSQESEMLVQATDALRSGLLPAKVRATLYRAIAMIDGVQISDSAVNLDGTVGTGFTVSSPALQEETIIDQVSGNFIGERTVTRQADSGIPAGTVIGYSAVRTSIVGELGATTP